ncbi:16567_t:CDS:2, partial [Cetraspora pellucida]
VQREDSILQPGFICTSGNHSSSIQTSLSNAITIAYNMIFKTKTTFFGSAVIGLNQINITSQLLEDIYFILIFLTLDIILIVVLNIEDTDTYDKFASSLITKKGKNGDRYLVKQQIVNNKFILDFYKEMDLKFYYKDKSALNKDVCAWKAMLNAYGCTNITPFEKNIS